MEEIIKSYKGFNKDMTCKNKQYEVGKDYEEDKAVACECGMHACEYPLDCFKYYPPSKSVYCEVEQSGDISRHDDDSKIASTKMRIGAQLNIAGIVNAAIKYTKEKVEKLIGSFKKKEINVFQGDYTGVDPDNKEDVISLKEGYQENEKSSAPTFHYVLRDVIHVE